MCDVESWDPLKTHVVEYQLSHHPIPPMDPVIIMHTRRHYDLTSWKSRCLKSFVILNPEAQKLEERNFKISKSDKRKQQTIKDKEY